MGKFIRHTTILNTKYWILTVSKCCIRNISYLIIFPDLVDEYQQYQDATADDDEDDEEEEYEQDGDY